MSFVRTALGDIDPADLGVTYAHEQVRRRLFVDDPARASTFAEVA